MLSNVRQTIVSSTSLYQSSYINSYTKVKTSFHQYLPYQATNHYSLFLFNFDHDWIYSISHLAMIPPTDQRRLARGQRVSDRDRSDWTCEFNDAVCWADVDSSGYYPPWYNNFSSLLAELSHPLGRGYIVSNGFSLGKS